MSPNTAIMTACLFLIRVKDNLYFRLDRYLNSWNVHRRGFAHCGIYESLRNASGPWNFAEWLMLASQAISRHGLMTNLTPIQKFNQFNFTRFGLVRWTLRSSLNNACSCHVFVYCRLSQSVLFWSIGEKLWWTTNVTQIRIKSFQLNSRS